MRDNVILNKSFLFAVRIVKFSKYLNSKNEFVLSKQILRSGTSVGANIREAHNGESDKDFIHKLSIAQKEADETLYWLELFKESDIITIEEFNSLSVDIIEILKLLKSIILSTKKRLKS